MRSVIASLFLSLLLLSAHAQVSVSRFVVVGGKLKYQLFGSNVNFDAGVTSLSALTGTLSASAVTGLTPAVIGLPNVPNVDATNRAAHTGTQPVSTVVGAVSAVNGLTPTGGAITIPTATTNAAGLLAPADLLSIQSKASYTAIPVNNATHGQVITHNLNAANIAVFFQPTGYSDGQYDEGFWVQSKTANTITLGTPADGGGVRETLTGTIHIYGR